MHDAGPEEDEFGLPSLSTAGKKIKRILDNKSGSWIPDFARRGRHVWDLAGIWDVVLARGVFAFVS